VEAASDGRGSEGQLPARRGRRPRPTLLAVVALALLLLPALSGLPLAPVSGCGRWIALAAGFELLSLLGFVLVFKLVFCARVSWRRALSAALRGLGASTALPAGGLIGPAMGAYSERTGKGSLARLSRSAVAFVVLTNAPSVAMIAAVGLAMWSGLLAGTHDALLTLLPAGLALTVLAAGSVMRAAPDSRTARSSRSPRRLVRAYGVTLASLGGGVSEARALVRVKDWKLFGAVAYYAFDNAVLWAAFHAYGRAPAVGVVAMGYLVGSLGATLPTPAGIGAVEGGLIGALALYGVPAAAAAAAVLLYRGISLAIAAPLGALAWASQPLAELRLLPGRFRRLTRTHARRGANRRRSPHAAPSASAARPRRPHPAPRSRRPARSPARGGRLHGRMAASTASSDKSLRRTVASRLTMPSFIYDLLS
jgi:uncharacterized membrane protein YbhN (UPF0104 family)